MVMISSQLEVIHQAKMYLTNVSTADYTTIISPNFISSAGAHIRHIIDHYLAVITGIESGMIDYDVRSRGGKIETDPTEALQKIDIITEWISQLSPDDLAKTITLSTEVSVSTKNVQTVTTSVARELIFAGGHAVHHYAMIAQIALAQESSTLNITPTFGLAPSTATFLREQAEEERLTASDKV
jgi:hypothetical protein